MHNVQKFRKKDAWKSTLRQIVQTFSLVLAIGAIGFWVGVLLHEENKLVVEKDAVQVWHESPKMLTSKEAIAIIKKEYRGKGDRFKMRADLRRYNDHYVYVVRVNESDTFISNWMVHAETGFVNKANDYFVKRR
ncbi:MAG: hypothetical protein ACRC5C_00395 [Bacilli bacterium]